MACEIGYFHRACLIGVQCCPQLRQILLRRHHKLETHHSHNAFKVVCLPLNTDIDVAEWVRIGNGKHLLQLLHVRSVNHDYNIYSN